MKIAFSGVQCTGKSTIINELHKFNFFNNYNFCTESIRKLHKEGLKINEDGNDLTQNKVMLCHIQNLLEYDNAVYDRCILDGMCYTQYAYNHKKISENTYLLCKDIFNTFVKYYDIIFFIKPEFDVVEDGTRSTNIDFRNEMENIFEEYTSILKNVVILTGSVEQRLEQISNILRIEND